MKKHSLVIPLFLCLFLAAPSVCAQTMSDQQVLEYVKQGMAEGRTSVSWLLNWRGEASHANRPNE